MSGDGAPALESAAAAPTFSQPGGGSRRLQRLGIKSNEVDGRALKQLTNAGLLWLSTNKDTVNALNVFPVPDGDTGTNMVLTMQSAWKEVAEQDEPAADKLAAALARGALMGARGNSGVILSQLWRGFSRGLEGVHTYGPRELIHALDVAQETAYRGVVKPVEGTILTVAREAAEAGRRAFEDGATVWGILEALVAGAARSVERTPDLLPLLKQAGVVDSGGKGLFFLLEGMLRYVHGLPLDTPVVLVQALPELNFDAAASIEPGQDWEVVVDFRPAGALDLPRFYSGLEELGTSIQVGEGDGLYRMHIHVPDRTEYQPIEYIKTLGTITAVRLENLMDQMAALQAPRALAFKVVQPGEIAVVVVAPGKGLAQAFAEWGAAGVVSGGHTKNPSTREVLEAFENLPTDKVIILPNNKDIIACCQEAAQLTVKQVRVVPSRSVPQGLYAMQRYVSTGDLDVIARRMESALAEVETGEVTTAARSVDIDGVAVREGQIIGLRNGRLAAGSDSLWGTLQALLAAMHVPEKSVVTLYSGEGVSAVEANEIADRVRALYPNLEAVDLREGGQPHYYFILSAE